VNFLRRLSTRSLVLLAVGVLALAGGGAALAVAAGGGGPTPPPKPLDQAIHDALSAGAPDGVTARITFTNNLFPSGALLGQTGSALMTGASGRLWLTNDGRGRVELQSSAGDVQIVWNTKTITVYDASSNTVYRADLPAAKTGANDPTGSTPATKAPPALAEIDKLLTTIGVHAALSGAQPTNVGGQPAYSVVASPKHDGGLLGSVELAWDASKGVPLRVGIYAQGNTTTPVLEPTTPVLELAVSDIAYGAAATDVAVAPPAGAKVVDLGTGTHTGTEAGGSGTPAVTGLGPVSAAAGFTVVAPDTLVGLPRQDVRLVGGNTALAVYGQGLGAIVVVERQAGAAAGSPNQLQGLPTVSLDGITAHELATQLGTILEWQSGTTSYVLAGSVPPAAAEAAAKTLK
jgi:outer membrane lipoprotein-sorting protein